MKRRTGVKEGDGIMMLSIKQQYGNIFSQRK